MKKPKGKNHLRFDEDGNSSTDHQPSQWAKNNAYDTENLDFSQPPQDLEKWYTAVPQDPVEFPPCATDKLQQLQQEAKNILESEASGYNIRASKNSELSWVRTVMTKGTGKDKVAAFTLMVQEKPMYNLQALQSLVNLVRPGKKECLECIGTLVELFVTDLLPPNKKLKTFSQRPLELLEELSSGNPAGRRRRLAMWYFEDQLKTIYRDFIDSLRVIAAEAVDANKERAIKALAQLLESHPEQEALLLSNLVNKLGDQTKKVAASAMRCLSKVLYKHPNMMGVIVNEVEKLLFRSHIGQRARYYGVCFLSQMAFRKTDSQLAANVIKIYFCFFKACVKQGDVDSKMLGTLLSGVNRAYPFAREAMDSIADELETLYKVIHMAPFHVGLQGLSLLFQVSDYKNFISDRFYSVLYRKLLDPALLVTTHSGMFLNLVYLALSKDESVPRVRVFIKRLLQVCCYMPVPLLCGTLYMVSQLMKKRSSLAAMSQGPVAKIENEGIKSDALPAAFLEDDSEDEHYEDVPLEENGSPKKGNKSKNEDGKKASSAWVFQKEKPKKFNKDAYDPMQRNPLHANGELCSFSELCVLSKHFHPTVALFASQILNGEHVTYSGDPMQDFTLSRFLERFSFKNPKKQPAAPSSSLFGKRQNYSASGLRGLPVLSRTYLNVEESKVPVEERYLFWYLQRRRNTIPDKKKKRADEDDSDLDSVASEEFEDMLEDLMKKRGLIKDVDGDDDLDFADEFTKNMSSKKSKKEKVDESEDEMGQSEDEGDSENEFDELNSDEEEDGDADEDDIDEEEPKEKENTMDFDSDEDLEDNEDLDLDDLDDDAEDMDFDDETDEEIDVKGKKKKKKNDMDINSLFASAEEFSELLEAAGSTGDGGSGAVSNKDKAPLKQLKWEAERDRWMKGFKNFSKGGKKFTTPKKGKPLGVKRPPFKANKKRNK